jgi:hypothetical protein
MIDLYRRLGEVLILRPNRPGTPLEANPWKI